LFAIWCDEEAMRYFSFPAMPRRQVRQFFALVARGK